MKKAYAAFWIVFAVAMAVYSTMLTWTLPAVSTAAGGLPAFDLRPGGYTFDEAHRFLVALEQGGGVAAYRLQQRLDLAYPALIAVSMLLGIACLTPPRIERYRWLLASVALPSAGFDYLENHAIARLLEVGSSGITPEMVATASRWSVLKAISTSVAMTLLLVLVVAWAVRKLRQRAPHRASPAD